MKICEYKNCKKGHNRKSIYCSRRCKNLGASSKRRKLLKEMAVQLLGGKCEKCGYNKCLGALHFHHKDPNEKSFGLSSKGITRSWDAVKNEVNKKVHPNLCELSRRRTRRSLSLYWGVAK